MRALLLLCSQLAGCFLLLERIDGEDCGEEFRSFCAENSLVLCVNDDLFRVDCGEALCDAGNQICSQCGDSLISPGEDCDDGNLISDDGCDATCLTSGCNSGFFSPGELCLGAPEGFSLVGSPRDVTLGDLDRDGDLDLAVATNTGTDGLVELLHNEQGQLSPAGAVSIKPGVSSVRLADLDLDTRLDLIIASPLDNRVYTSLQRAEGFATPLGSSTAESAPHLLTLGDFNGDSKQDIGVAHLGCQDTSELNCQASILLSDEDGLLSNSQVSAGFLRTQSTIEAIDLDGDQTPELLATFSARNEFGVAKINPVGLASSFEAKESFIGALNSAPLGAAVLTAPLPGILVLTSDAVIEFENQGALQFVEATTHPLSSIGAAIAVRDLDLDGDPEVIILFADAPHLEIFQTQDFSLRASIDLSPLGGAPEKIAIGDLNGDEALDLVLTNPITKEVVLLLSEP